MRRLGTEKANHHYPDSHTRLEADPVLQESAEWQLEIGCWRPKPVKWNMSRHRGGQEDKRVGSEMASLWQAHLAALLKYDPMNQCAIKSHPIFSSNVIAISNTCTKPV